MSTELEDFPDLSDLSVRELERMEMLLLLKETRLRFAMDHHKNTRGERLDFTYHPHIRAIYNSLSPNIVLQGSTQSMKSEWANVNHLAASYIGLQVFYVLPKFEHRTTYVMNRINRCVENVEEYKKIMGSGFFDSVSLKSFGKGVIKYVGSNVLADFTEFPADMVVIEEVDDCHAPNLEYAIDRLGASKFKFIVRLGNPRIEGRGINYLYNLSDKRTWHVICENCKDYSKLDWFETIVHTIKDREDNIIDYRLRDEDWYPGCRRELNAICPKCGGRLNRRSMENIWIPEFPERNIEGYHISAMCSPSNSLAEMWENFKQSIHDPKKMQRFHNSVLGLPYAGAGNKLTEEMLRKCNDNYNFILEPDRGYIPGDRSNGPCSMGVDVNGTIFDVRISEVLNRAKRKAVFIGKVGSTEQLHELIARYNVEKVVMDSMPEVMLARDFQDECAVDCWLCRYRGEGKDGKFGTDSSDRLLNVDRTEALDRSFAEIKKRKNVLPNNFRELLDGAFVSEMCKPVRQVVEDARGNARYEWTKCTDHSRHSDTYDMLAANMVNEGFIEDISVG